jgi:hypothetical protein
MKNYKMGHANIRVNRYGYGVVIYDDENNEVAKYEAGNSSYDSAPTYGYLGLDTLPISKLLKYARQTAREMLNESELKGKIRYDKELSIYGSE